MIHSSRPQSPIVGQEYYGIQVYQKTTNNCTYKYPPWWWSVSNKHIKQTRVLHQWHVP